MVKLSLVGALAAACVNVPPFQPRDAAPGDGADGDAPDGGNETAVVSVVQDSSGVVVTGPGYTMRFSSAGSLFPYQIEAGGQHLMGGSQSCNDEQAMGIALYPVFRANGADFSGMGTPSISIPLTGPSVGQVSIDWSGSFSCSVETGSISGTSIFSFFPDGRLTRFDIVTNGSEVDAADCMSCVGGFAASFFLTSFTTLIVDSGAFLSDGDEPTFDEYGEVVSPGSSACVRERGQSIAFAWVDTQTRLRVVNETPSRAIAFVKDMFSGTTLPALEWRTTTQMGVSAAENCGALEARILPFTDDDHAVAINGTPLGAALTDGIFGGFPRPDGYPVDFPVVIEPTVQSMPAGFAVWLSSANIPQNLTLTHSGSPTGTSWYRLQRVSQTSLLVWFDVPLGTGETITISGT